MSGEEPGVVRVGIVQMAMSESRQENLATADRFVGTPPRRAPG